MAFKNGIAAHLMWGCFKYFNFFPFKIWNSQKFFISLQYQSQSNIQHRPRGEHTIAFKRFNFFLFTSPLNFFQKYFKKKRSFQNLEIFIIKKQWLWQ